MGYGKAVFLLLVENLTKWADPTTTTTNPIMPSFAERKAQLEAARAERERRAGEEYEAERDQRVGGGGTTD